MWTLVIRLNSGQSVNVSYTSEFWAELSVEGTLSIALNCRQKVPELFIWIFSRWYLKYRSEFPTRNIAFKTAHLILVSCLRFRAGSLIAVCTELRSECCVHGVALWTRPRATKPGRCSFWTRFEQCFPVSNMAAAQSAKGADDNRATLKIKRRRQQQQQQQQPNVVELSR